MLVFRGRKNYVKSSIGTLPRKKKEIKNPLSDSLLESHGGGKAETVIREFVFSKELIKTEAHGFLRTYNVEFVSITIDNSCEVIGHKYYKGQQSFRV